MLSALCRSSLAMSMIAETAFAPVGTAPLLSIPVELKRWAGHSHWANIKHKKGANDASRSKLYAKLSNEISAAVRAGGGDTTDSNLRLHSVLLKARASNMPKDRIETAVKGSQKDGSVMEEVVYEAQGPGNVSMIIEALTDNRKRTAPQIRSILNKFDGQLLKPGALTPRLFTSAGLIVIRMGGNYGTEDELIDKVSLIESIENFEKVDDTHIELTCSPGQLRPAVAELKKAGCEIETFEFSYIPSERVEVSETDQNEKGHSTHDILHKVIDEFDDHPEVQRVTTNCANL